mgnify:CR=1 FL=1
MSDKPKGVVHCAKSTGITSKEADENQRRWTKDKYEYKNSDNKNHYDLSRSHLNFEIDQHGRIQPLGTSTPIHILEQKRLAELGNKPDKPDSKVKHIRDVEYLISGGADAMRKMAFGNQKVDYSWDASADNSKVKRQPYIEKWAKDVWKWMAEKHGAENIVGFSVHLDESSPHIHVHVIPVNPKGKVSYKHFFGKDKYDGQKRLTELHTDYHEQIGKLWGFDRGDDTSGRDVHHKSKAEYFGELNQEIKKAETRLKGLQTMIVNLETEKKVIEAEIQQIQTDIDNGKGDIKAQQIRLLELNKKTDSIDEKIRDKQEKLLEADRKLSVIRANTHRSETLKTQLIKTNMDFATKMKQDADILIKSALFGGVLRDLESIAERLPDVRDELMSLDNSPLLDACVDTNALIGTAVQFFIMGYQGEPISTGGGGGSSDDNWWRDKDEDDEHWARRCIFKAHAHLSRRSATTMRRH